MFPIPVLVLRATYDPDTNTVTTAWTVAWPWGPRAVTFAWSRPLRKGERRPHEHTEPETCWCEPVRFADTFIHRDASVPPGKMFILAEGQSFTRELP